MTPGMTVGAVLDFIGGVRAAIFLAFAVALGTMAGVQTMRLKSAKADVKELEASVANYAVVNKANVSAIGAMEERIKVMVDERRAEAKAAAKAVAAAQSNEQSVKAQLAKKERELRHVYAKYPNAAAWGAAGVDADVLRQLPGNPDQDR